MGPGFYGRLNTDEMIKNRVIQVLSILILTGFSLPAFSQGADKLRINEIMTWNETNFEDDFGVRSGWLELYNTSYATVNVGGCYLTDDLNNPTKYQIPKGDVLTSIKPRQHILFWADNHPTRGTFHVNFTFEQGEKNFIALFDVNGRDLIDSMSIPPLDMDQSFGRITDGLDNLGLLEKTTPSSNNVFINQAAASDRFLEHDPAGVGMAVTAMGVVFIALILLFLAFKQIGRTAIRLSQRRALASRKQDAETVLVSGKKAEAESGEIFAAIGLAMHEFQNESHDMESTVLTIQRVARSYSPWSSKLYGLRQTPRK